MKKEKAKKEKSNNWMKSLNEIELDQKENKINK